MGGEVGDGEWLVEMVQGVFTYGGEGVLVPVGAGVGRSMNWA